MTRGDNRAQRIAVPRAMGMAVVFGLFALLIVLANLTLPIAGTNVVTDPREIFTSLGSAVTGPLGGAVIGFFAAVREPNGMHWASLLAHVSGCVWVGWAYGRLVYDRLDMPALLVGWFVLVLSYYGLFLVPGFVLGASLFHPEAYAESFGAGTSLPSAGLQLARGALPEALITASLTTLVLVAVPARFRRPLR